MSAAQIDNAAQAMRSPSSSPETAAAPGLWDPAKRIRALSKDSRRKDGHTVMSLLALLEEYQALVARDPSRRDLTEAEISGLNLAEERVLKQLAVVEVSCRDDAFELLDVMQARVCDAARLHAAYGKYEVSAMVRAELAFREFAVAEARVAAERKAEEVRQRGLAHVMPGCPASEMRIEFINLIRARNRIKGEVPWSDVGGHLPFVTVNKRLAALEQELSWKQTNSLSGIALALAVTMEIVNSMGDDIPDELDDQWETVRRFLHTIIRGLPVAAGFQLHPDIQGHYVPAKADAMTVLRDALFPELATEASS